MEKLNFINLVNEYLQSVRKQFGKFSQVRWCVEEISKDTLTYGIEVGEKSSKRNSEGLVDEFNLVYNVRNAMLGQLGDLLPAPKFNAFYTDVYKDTFRRKYDGLFYDSDTDEFLLRSNVIPVIDTVLEKRGEYKSKFFDGWGRLNG